MTTRRTFIAAGGLLAAGRSDSRAEGAGYPDHPIRLVVPNPPGGPSDVAARFLVDPMRLVLGQPLVIDNRPGAAGLIGSAAVANAPADGYTILMTSRSNHVIAPLVQGTKTVDPLRDLVPVALGLRAVGLFVTHSRAPFKTLRELIAYAKANPKGVFYGSAGIGATNHIAIEQFKTLAGIELTHVPYKGSGSLVTGLMGGEVQLALLDFSSAQPGLESGGIVALAQTASRRLPTMAQVPTLIESGFKDFDASFWIGLAAPKATPNEAVVKLNGALNQALADLQVKARAQIYGWELVGGPPDVLASTIARDMVDFPPVIRQLDIKAT